MCFSGHATGLFGELYKERCFSCHDTRLICGYAIRCFSSHDTRLLGGAMQSDRLMDVYEAFL